MDKLKEVRYTERGRQIIVNRIKRSDVINKVNELVEGYNEIMKIIERQMKRQNDCDYELIQYKRDKERLGKK